MGRRCCCDGGCVLIDVTELRTAQDFLKVFTTTDSYSVADSTADIYNDYYETLTFTGSCSLSLTYPDALYGNDNLAIDFSLNFNSALAPTFGNLTDGDQITETITLTIGANTITTAFTRTEGYVNGYKVDCSFTVMYNNTLLYIRQNNETTDFDRELNNSVATLLQYPHYLIRKDNKTGNLTENKLYYFIGDNLIGVCVDANPNAPIHFTYSWTSTNANATLTFNPTYIKIWKPDKWWKLVQFKTVPKKKTNLSSEEANKLYDIFANNEVESQGCIYPLKTDIESGQAVNAIVNEDLKFSELSPNIAIRFYDFKGSHTIFAGIPLEAWYDDPNTGEPVNSLETLGGIIQSKEQELIQQNNGLYTPVQFLDVIMTTQAASWRGSNYTYKLRWVNGADVTLDYTAVENNILNGITGGKEITFQQMTPVTVMTNDQPYYTDLTDEDSYHHQGFAGYNASWGRLIDQTYHYWEHTGTDTVLCRLDPFRYYENISSGIPSDLTELNLGDPFMISGSKLTIKPGIIAPNISVNLSKNGVCTADFIFYNPGFGTNSRAWSTSHITDAITTTLPSHGQVTRTWYAYDADNPNPDDPYEDASTLGYYKIQYKHYGGITATKDQFEYKITDQFGAKSTGVITINFIDGVINDSISSVITPSSLAIPNACKDYETVCEVTCSIITGSSAGNTALYYVHPDKTCKLSDLVGHYAEIKTPLVWTSIDGQIQDTLKVEFLNPVLGSCNLAHDNNYGLADSYLQTNEQDSVDHLEAKVQIWYGMLDEVEEGLPFIVDLNPTNPVGCPSSSDIGLSHHNSLTSTYSGTFQKTFTEGVNTYNETQEISISSGLSNLPYYLGSYINQLKSIGFNTANHKRRYEITDIKVVYVSGKEVNINLRAMDNTYNEARVTVSSVTYN